MVGFKWHNTKGCWYAKESNTTLAAAEKIQEFYAKKAENVQPKPETPAAAPQPKAEKPATKVKRTASPKKTDVKLGSGDVYMTADQKLYILLDGKKFELKTC